MKILILVLTLALVACKGSEPAPEKKPEPVAAKPAIHILVAYGQSNAAGSSPDIESAPVVPQGWGYLWDGKQRHLTEPTRWNKAELGSAWSAYAVRFYELTGEPVVIVNVAIDGRTSYELLPSQPKGADAFNKIKDALGFYDADYDVKSVSMVYLQGEADVRELYSVQNHLDNVVEIEKAFELLHPKANLYTARIGYASFHDSTYTDLAFDLGDSQMQSSERPVYAKTPSFHSKGLMSNDGIHYLQEAYNQMGHEIADNIAYYLNGVDVSYQIKRESASMQKYNPY